MNPTLSQTPDLSRFSALTQREELLSILEELQEPCPWGDLAKKGFPNEYPEDPEMAQIPCIPLALVLGSGFPYGRLSVEMMQAAYEGLACAESFRKIIWSDILNPRMARAPADYLYLDLTHPDSIDLFGYRVHALMSSGVFTYDGLGVNFKNSQNEKEAATKLSELLMPGGIVASDNIWRNCLRFERLLINEFGFVPVRKNFQSVILQKPF